jgi:hypothetical protein
MSGLAVTDHSRLIGPGRQGGPLDAAGGEGIDLRSSDVYTDRKPRQSGAEVEDGVPAIDGDQNAEGIYLAVHAEGGEA